MTAGTWIALGGLVVTAMGGLGWLGVLTWHGGRQAQRLDGAVTDIGDLKRTQAEHGTAIAGWSHVAALLEEVRKDVKAIQLGRSTRRTSGTGD